MKPLNSEQLISLLPSDTAVIDKATKAFDIGSVLFRVESGFMRHAILEGWTTPVTIEYQGQPAFMLTYHLTADGGMCVDGLAAIGRGTDIHVAFAAGEMIAKKHNCKYIRFLTFRRGMVTTAMLNGFSPETVCMVKHL